MNDLHSAKMRTYISVLKTCTRNKEAWSNIPAFNNSYQTFSAYVNQINEINKQLQNSSKSTTETKNQLKKAMIDHTLVLAGAIKAYVNVSKNTALKEVADMTISRLVKAKDMEAEAVCLNVLEKANSVIDNLSPYGITNVEVELTKTSINEYAKMVGRPKEEILRTKNLNKQLAMLIKAADNILTRELDGLMIRFKSSRERFYDEYNLAKKV